MNVVDFARQSKEFRDSALRDPGLEQAEPGGKPNAADAGKMSVEEWLQIRKVEATKIDSATAEVAWSHAYTADPYGVENLLPEYEQIGRVFFARAPGSDIWVSLRDLPQPVCARLLERDNAVAHLSSFDDCPF